MSRLNKLSARALFVAAVVLGGGFAGVYRFSDRAQAPAQDSGTLDGHLPDSATGIRCDPDMFVAPARHERGTRPPSIDAALRRRLCSVSLAVTGEGQTAAGSLPYGFDLLPVPLDVFPGLVDSNSPAYWRGESFNILNSAWSVTLRSQGGGVLGLSTPTPVTLPRPPRPGNVWIEAVWQDPETYLLYAWYHFEPADVECQTAPIIGAAVSANGGATWEDRGFVLENGYGVDCRFENGYFSGGNGDFSVIVGPDGEYLYFLFSNYQGPLREQGVAIARSAMVDRGQPGTVWKYYQGGWEEPGLGGRTSALFRTPTGWAGPRVDAFWGPSVHWNDFLQSYVMLLNRATGALWEQEGIYITFSPDLLRWSRPVKILETNEYYPQVLGLEFEASDTRAGQTVRLYVGGISAFLIQFDLAPAPLLEREVPRLETPESLMAAREAMLFASIGVARPSPESVFAGPFEAAEAPPEGELPSEGGDQDDGAPPAMEVDSTPESNEGTPLPVPESPVQPQSGSGEGVSDR